MTGRIVVVVIVVGTFVLDHMLYTTRHTAHQLLKLAQREAAARAAAGPQNAERSMLLSADRHTLPAALRAPHRRRRIRRRRFYVYDRHRLAEFRQGEPWLSALKRGQALGGLSCASDGVIAAHLL